MKSRHLFGIIVLTSVLVTMLLSGPAYAISNGQPDTENNWPYVCWVVTYPGEGPYVWLGTGSLIAPEVVLTAGHVADAGDPLAGAWAQVSFAPVASWPPFGADWQAVESWYTHPEYELGVDPQLTEWISHDVGILILEEPVIMDEYGELPTEGLVDTLPMMTDVDQVGYGVQEMVHVPGTGAPYWDWEIFGGRFYATAQLVDSEHEFGDEFMKLTANPAQEKGGTCFGDSGGPNLLGETNIILGVTSWGTNYQCAGVSYVARVDTADVLDWIYGFLA